MTGTIKSYSPQHGYGFVTTDDGQELFFHVLQCKVKPEAGMRVQFHIKETTRGTRAVGLRSVYGIERNDYYATNGRGNANA